MSRAMGEGRERDEGSDEGGRWDGGERGWGGAAPHTYSGGVLNGQRRNKADGIHVKEQPQSPSKNKERKAGSLKGA